MGLEGDMFANAAEIMRWEGGWIESGSKWEGGSGFSIQLYWLFARQSINNGQANYGMVSIKALLSFAVYLDDITMVGNLRISCFNLSLGMALALKLLADMLCSITMHCTSCTTTFVQVYMAITIQELLNLSKLAGTKAMFNPVCRGQLMQQK